MKAVGALHAPDGTRALVGRHGVHVAEFECGGCALCRSLALSFKKNRSISVHPDPHAMLWVCYRRRNQWLWLRLALASLSLPLMWLARVVCLHAMYCECTGLWRSSDDVRTYL